MRVSKKYLNNFTMNLGSVKAYKKISSWRKSYKIRLSNNELIRMDFLGCKDKTVKMQKMGLSNGLTCFPEILGLLEGGGRVVKLSEWIDGELFTTLFESDSLDKNMFFLLGDQMGQMNSIKDAHGASLHNDDITFRNMVWTDRPIIIDMDRTSFDPYPDNSLVKILLKRIIDREFIAAFLEGYARHRDVSNLSALCEARNWIWKR